MTQKETGEQKAALIISLFRSSNIYLLKFQSACLPERALIGNLWNQVAYFRQNLTRASKDLSTICVYRILFQLGIRTIWLERY